MSLSLCVRLAVLAAAGCLLSGCLPMMIASTAVGVTAKTVGVAAKGTGMVVGTVIPGGGKDKDKD